MREVRCISSGNSMEFTEGKVYKLSEKGYIKDNYGKCHTNDNDGFHHLYTLNHGLRCEAEFADPYQIERDELKTGHVLVLRNGEIRIIMPIGEHICAISENNADFKLENVSLKLEYVVDVDSVTYADYDWKVDLYNQFTVEEVYGAAYTYDNAMEISTFNRPLLWNRKKSENKECYCCQASLFER